MADPSSALPSWRPLHWLTDAGPGVPDEVRVRLLDQFFASALTLLIGSLANTAINLVAVIRHPTPEFGTLLAIELALLLGRVGLLGYGRFARARGLRLPIDLLLASSLAWAALVGLGTALCFQSGDPVLQILAPVSMMGIGAGMVTRNNGAPRFVVLQLMLCDLPLKATLPFYGEAWLLMALGQAALFFLGMVGTVFRLQKTCLAAMMAEHDSRRRASHDALTGLRNRSGLIEALRNSLEARGAAVVVAVLYIDLDGFKAINDRFGHPAGDALLRQAATRIAATLPDGCVAARFGGDEFVVLARGQAALQAAALGERLVAAIGEPYDHDGVPAPFGASVGIAWAFAPTTPEAILAEADAALYAAKAGGKGRCAVSARSRPEGRVAA